jgi:hypothetical protein
MANYFENADPRDLEMPDPGDDPYSDPDTICRASALFTSL